MILTKYAQSTIEIEENGFKVLIDPGKFNYLNQTFKKEDFKKINILIITHKHGDHFDIDTVKSIYDRCDSHIITVKEVSEILTKINIKSEIINLNQIIDIGDFSIKGIKAKHIVEGENIDTVGILLKNRKSKNTIYFTSDTLYLEEKPKADIVILPINNRGVAMGFDDAFKFLNDIDPKIGIPVHYDGEKDKHINPIEFAERFKDNKIKIQILGFQDRIELD